MGDVYGNAGWDRASRAGESRVRSPRAPEPTLTARRQTERLQFPKLNLNNGHEHDLSQSAHGVDGERLRAAIPATDQQGPLIVGVDEPDQVAEDDAVPVAQSGAGQDQSCEAGVGDVDGDARRHQLGLPR